MSGLQLFADIYTILLVNYKNTELEIKAKSMQNKIHETVRSKL